MFKRFATAVSLAATLSIGLTGVVAADNVVGQTGHYLFTDGSGEPGAGCLYRQTDAHTWRLFRIVVRPPMVWWPDTNADINRQHGRVGWRVIVWHKAPADSSWTLLTRSPIQRAIAYEDQPAYDPADRAPFTRIRVDINGAAFPVSEQFRATVKAMWFRRDGTVRGYVTHDVQYYREIISGSDFGVAPNPYCVDAYQAA